MDPSYHGKYNVGLFAPGWPTHLISVSRTLLHDHVGPRLAAAELRAEKGGEVEGKNTEFSLKHDCDTLMWPLRWQNRGLIRLAVIFANMNTFCSEHGLTRYQKKPWNNRSVSFLSQSTPPSLIVPKIDLIKRYRFPLCHPPAKSRNDQSSLNTWPLTQLDTYPSVDINGFSSSLYIINFTPRQQD